MPNYFLCFCHCTEMPQLFEWLCPFIGYCTFLIWSPLSTERYRRLWIQIQRREMVFLDLFHIQFLDTSLRSAAYDAGISCNHQIIRFTCVTRMRELCSTNKICQSSIFWCMIRTVSGQRLVPLNGQYVWLFSFINSNVLFRVIIAQKSKLGK